MSESVISFDSPSFKKAITGSYHELIIVFSTCISAMACLLIDKDIPLYLQNLLGVSAWGVLLAFLMFESRQVQSQVLIAVAFATIGEYYASVYMEGYTYRLANVPAYVPPGHGLIYLSAVALGRSAIFKKYYQPLFKYGLVAGIVWVVWGLTIAPQLDVLGALLFTVFLLFLKFGKSAPVYLAAFYVTSYLEWVGTLAGTWTWAAIDPVAGLPQGNPPSGVAAWYCLVDAVALTVSPYLLGFLGLFKSWKLARKLIKLEQKLVENILVQLRWFRMVLENRIFKIFGIKA